MAESATASARGQDAEVAAAAAAADGSSTSMLPSSVAACEQALHKFRSAYEEVQVAIQALCQENETLRRQRDEQTRRVEQIRDLISCDSNPAPLKRARTVAAVPLAEPSPLLPHIARHQSDIPQPSQSIVPETQTHPRQQRDEEDQHGAARPPLSDTSTPPSDHHTQQTQQTQQAQPPAPSCKGPREGAAEERAGESGDEQRAATATGVAAGRDEGCHGAQGHQHEGSSEGDQSLEPEEKISHYSGGGVTDWARMDDASLTELLTRTKDDLADKLQKQEYDGMLSALDTLSGQLAKIAAERLEGLLKRSDLGRALNQRLKKAGNEQVKDRSKELVSELMTRIKGCRDTHTHHDAND
ncbi:unnamed protein product [Vitrella brassicaformis CCMP3155]|uniref:TFIIS N-terminal domain-containing protein n=2 Tax=Vitrella brassicaformis TaxID=1169539 RepID=A0A0G4EEM3_VITBC|nr:unnamed protein product [Vitrella brassicaformis CCMP3155]|eukprot:CEL94126.1 unnamed protein product [Vitrella brassicaformis CCMP3155]